MLMHRYNEESLNPYEITFCRYDENGMSEPPIAFASLSFTPYDQERLNISDDFALHCAALGAHIVQVTREDVSQPLRASLQTVRLLGSALRLYSQNTAEAMEAMQQFSPRTAVAYRRLEGSCAGAMAEVITRRNISLYDLTPKVKKTVGFQLR